MPLLIQPLAVAAALLLLGVWLSTAHLSATERNTLAVRAILAATGQHLLLTAVAAAIVLVIGLPLGVLLTRRGVRRVSGIVLALANLGQAAPPFGLIVLIAALIGLGWNAALIGLVLYALLPVLRNTMIGIEQVDPRLVEAGRGMGMSAAAVLLRIELPLAVPIVLAGVRTALVLLVGTAALGAFVGAGGLGQLITTGVSLYLMRVLIAGAILIALLALVIDWLGRIVEVVAHPKGI
ncbi:ABC transporter permease [Amnibacterium sp.]|uniref:ABC transporter permease n=1 Tax=Amnibacterium sp. TaxID=1872496 RepID=UPI003F7CAF72